MKTQPSTSKRSDNPALSVSLFSIIVQFTVVKLSVVLQDRKSELMQQDGRKKGTAKVTVLCSACSVMIFT